MTYFWFVKKNNKRTLYFFFSFVWFFFLEDISTHRDNTHSVSPLWLTETTFSHILTSGDSTLTLSISTHRDNTHSILHFDFQHLTSWKCIHSTTFFFLVLPFRLELLQPRTQPQKFHETLKETNNQQGRRHVPPRTRCYISIYRYLTWNT